MARTINAGKATVRLGLDDVKFKKSLITAQKKLKFFGRAVKQTGMAFMRFGATMALPLVAGIKVFADFEKQMAMVSTMLDVPERDIKRFTAGIRKLAVEYGESTEALTAGLYTFLSAGVSTKNVMEALEVATRSAIGGMSDTATATKAIVAVMNSYKLSAQRAGDVSDWLFTVVKKGLTDFKLIAPAIGRVAATAAVAGVKLEDLGAVIATLTSVGTETNEAITQTASVILAIQKPTQQAAAYAKLLSKEMKGVNIEMSAAALKTEGLSVFLRKIQSLKAGQLVKLFPERNAYKAVVALTDSFSKYEEILAKMKNRTGEADEAFNKMATTLTFMFNQIKQGVIIAFGKLGEGMAEPLREVGKTIKSILDWLGEFAAKHQTLTKIYLYATTAIIGLGAALLITGKLIAAGVIAVKVFGWALVAWKGIVIAAKYALFGLYKALVFLLAHPVVLVIAAITVALVALVLIVKSATASFYKLNSAFAELVKLGDKQRETDILRMKRLGQLADKEKLNSEEMSEAKSLIRDLELEYGKLGLKLDETTGKIIGYTTAQKNLNKVMRERAIEDTMRAMREIELNIERLKKEKKDAYFGIGKMAWRSEIKKINKDLREQVKLFNELADKLDSLYDKDESALTGKGRTEAEKLKDKIDKDEIKTAKGITDEKKEMQRQALYDLKTLKIKQEKEAWIRERNLIRQSYVEKIRLAKKAGATEETIEAIKAARKLSLAASFQRFVEAGAERMINEAEEENRIEEGYVYNRKRLSEEIEELKLKSTMKGFKLEKALLDLKKKREIEAAKAAGLSVDDIIKKYDLLAKLAEQARAGSRQLDQVSSRGTFNAAAMQAFGAAPPMDQVEKYTKETAKNTKSMDKKLDNIAEPTYGP